MNNYTSPQDYLLFKIYENYGWGDPFGYEKSPDKAWENEELNKILYQNRYWTKPEMEHSEKECEWLIPGGFDLPGNIFDLLGEYRCVDVKEEGKIILYEKCIRRFGLMYYEGYGKFMHYARQYCIDLVREIVIWHELGHWITHWMPDKAGKRWDAGSYSVNSQNISFHEGLAQLFTFYALLHYECPERQSDYMSVFQCMLRNQDPHYHGHILILQNRNFSWNGVFRALQAIRTHPQANYADLYLFCDKMSNPEDYCS